MAVSDSPEGTPWLAKGGCLTGACDKGFAAIASRKKIQGNMRIEWTAMSRAKNENLNCFIAGQTRLDWYAFHVGGFGFANQVVLTKGKDGRFLDMAILDDELQAFNPYAFRMEKEERSIRLFINNALVIEHEDPDVLGGPGHQAFGFEVTGGNMVEIHDIRVFHQPLPLPLAVSPLTIADSYFENRLYDQALVQCREILTAYPDTDLAKSAAYKIACVQQKQGDVEGALGAFEQFEKDNPCHPLATSSMYERSRILRSVGCTEDADRVCRRLAEECPGQPVLRMVLYDITASLMETCPVEEMEKGASTLRAWASALDQPLTNNLFLDKFALILAGKKRPAEILEKCSELRARCARVLLENLGRPDRVLAEYPDQRKYCALALNSLNRYRETLVTYPEQRSACANALYACDDLERMLSEYPEQRELCVRALARLGRVDEIIAGYRDLKSTCASSLTYMGQIDKVASLYHDDPTYQVWVLYAQSKFEELLERHPGNAPWCAESLLVLDRPREVLDKYRSVAMSCAKALLFLNRPREVLEEYPDMETQCIDALCMMGEAGETLRRYSMNFTFRTNYFMNSGRAGEFLERYPYDTLGCATALLALGNAREILSTFSVNSWQYVAALRETGQFLRIHDDWSNKIDSRADSLLKMGRFDELGCEITGRRRSERAQMLIHAGKLDNVLSGYTNCRTDCARVLLYQKRYDEVEKRYPDQMTMCRFADLYAGRTEYMLDKHGNDPMLSMEMLLGRHLQTLEMYCAGATEKAHAQWKELSKAPVNCVRAYLRFPCFLLVPFVRFLEGAHQEFRAAYEDIALHCRYHFAQELWHSALFILGGINEATFDAQPSRQSHESNAALCRAMRAEVNDDKAAALHWYTLLYEMPPWIKPLNPVIETFTSWRKRELEKLHL